MSDFSLMDAIECGIVKLPRVPVADNLPGGDMPMFRNLWEHIGKQDAEEGARQAGKSSTRSSLPVELLTALDALYGHYEKTFELWERGGHRRAAGLHRGLQQHLDLEARLRIHLRLSARERRRLDDARERAPRPVPQLRRVRQPAARARTRS